VSGEARQRARVRYPPFLLQLQRVNGAAIPMIRHVPSLSAVLEVRQRRVGWVIGTGCAGTPLQ
jgi:hypothetical protein